MSEARLVYSRSLPIPTTADPLVQLRYVYEERGALSNCDATKAAYVTAFRNHVRYIMERDGHAEQQTIKPVFVDDEFSVDFFFQMQQWFHRRGVFNLSTSLSSFREVIRHCRANGYITTDVIITTVRTKHRDAHSGDTHTAYDEELYRFVRQALKDQYRFLTNVAKPYVKTGLGQDPYVRWNAGRKAPLVLLELLERTLEGSSGVATEKEMGAELCRGIELREGQYPRRCAKVALAYLAEHGYIEAKPFNGIIFAFRKNSAKLLVQERRWRRDTKCIKRRIALQHRLEAMHNSGVNALPTLQRHKNVQAYERSLKDRKALERLGVFRTIRKITAEDGGWTIKIHKGADQALRELADESRYGWDKENNWRWYFENVMGGRLREVPIENYPEYKTFSQNISRCFLANPDARRLLLETHDGADLEKITRAVLTSWGVVPRLTSKMTVSLMAYLAMLSGLNVESLKDLKLGCLKYEPLTQTYYLEYFKARSGGRKELPLADEPSEELTVEDGDVLDESEYRGTDSDGKRHVWRKPIAFLPDAKRIENVIKLAEALTAGFRRRAPKELRTKLFLFQSIDRSVSDINRYHFIDWVRGDVKPRVANLMKRSLRIQRPDLVGSALRKEEAKIERQIEKTSLAVSRLRSTLATNLVKQGAPIELVQAVLGHSSLLTTEQYLDKLQLEPMLYQEVATALNRLKSDRDKHVKAVGSVEELRRTIARSPTDKPSDGYIFETTGCLHCRDPHSPSTKIKHQHRDWVDGESVCSKWNMCLFCDNVIIVDVALPRLLAYQSKLKLDLSAGLISVRVNNQLVRKTVRLIDEIVDPKNGFFSKEVVDDARARAEAWVGRDWTEFFRDEDGEVT